MHKSGNLRTSINKMMKGISYMNLGLTYIPCVSLHVSSIFGQPCLPCINIPKQALCLSSDLSKVSLLKIIIIEPISIQHIVKAKYNIASAEFQEVFGANSHLLFIHVLGISMESKDRKDIHFFLYCGSWH